MARPHRRRQAAHFGGLYYAGLGKHTKREFPSDVTLPQSPGVARPSPLLQDKVEQVFRTANKRRIKEANAAKRKQD